MKSQSIFLAAKLSVAIRAIGLTLPWRGQVANSACFHPNITVANETATQEAKQLRNLIMTTYEMVSARATTAHLKREFTCDRQLHGVQIRIERKQFTVDLTENPRGKFLRITEEVNSGRRNSIVIPATGLELFRDVLNEVIGFSKTTPQTATLLPPRPPPDSVRRN
jgi:PurA ssDNA and RNA-binding protein